MRPSEEDLSCWMHAALAQAHLAGDAGEVPIGAVLVHDRKIIGAGHNRTEERLIAAAHAEILALEQAGQAHGSWRLQDCILVATVEPCVMCVGAALLARVACIVFGAYEPRFGALGSLYDLGQHNPFGPAPRVIGGICEEQCGSLIKTFFAARRAK